MKKNYPIWIFLVFLLFCAVGCKQKTEEKLFVIDDSSDYFTFISSDEIVDDKPVDIAPYLLFLDENGKELGGLDWSGGSLKFTGNMDESARIFFKYFWRNYVDQEGDKVYRKQNFTPKDRYERKNTR